MRERKIVVGNYFTTQVLILWESNCNDDINLSFKGYSTLKEFAHMSKAVSEGFIMQRISKHQNGLDRRTKNEEVY